MIKDASLGQRSHLLVNFWPFVVRNSLSSRVGNATDAISMLPIFIYIMTHSRGGGER